MTKNRSMKKTVWILTIAIAFAACGGNNNNNENTSGGNANMSNPNNTHSKAEALTDSTKLVNDSVVVPDTTQGHGNVGQKSATQNR
jgi:hypothetical protein